MFILYSAFLTLKGAVQSHEHTRGKTEHGMFTLVQIMHAKYLKYKAQCFFL